MAGLHLLKHAYDLSDTQVVLQWVENSYRQYFCGEVFFQTEPPLDPATLGHCRRQIGSEGMEQLLGTALSAAKKANIKLHLS